MQTEVSAPVVIYIEDDVMTGQVIEAELKDAGFSVCLASEGEEGLAFLRANEHAVCALVTDINLGGGMEGWAVAHEARTMLPNLPVIYVSGRESGEWTARGVPLSVMIAKPFVPAQVIVAISSLVNGSPPQA